MNKFKSLSPRLQGYLIASIVFLGITYALLFHITDETRKSCERLDEVRSVEYRVLAGAERSLRNQAEVADSPALKTQLKRRADAYEQYLTALEETTAEFAVRPGSHHVDCTQAHTNPWPF